MQKNKNTFTESTMLENHAQAVETNVSTGQIRDVTNRNILKDPVLCSQFLKDYVDKDLFQNLKPEDIKDESEKYQAYLGITFETDTVKKICMKHRKNVNIQDGDMGEETPLYLISLVEHKSQVDYNVSMQILRYMACIWNEYGKEMMSLKKGDIRNKSFRYPPILPIVYYEGAEKWTADIHLKDRILMYELFENYIPDFTYKLVSNHDYSNEELLNNEDEMSLLMMLGKAQTPEDVHRLVNAEKEKMEVIIRKAPEHILEIIASTLWSLCMKLNVPREEAEQCVRKVREREMGYWFENMEKMDIQEERRNTAKAREELEMTKQELEESRKAAETIREDAIKAVVVICKKHGESKKQAIEAVIESFPVDRKTAEDKVILYWEN